MPPAIRPILSGTADAEALQAMPLVEPGNAGTDLYGLGGNDTLYGSASAERLDGGEGNDVLFGGTGENTLVGAEGADTIYGEADADLVYGDGTDGSGGGDDTVFAGEGDNTVEAGGGANLVYAGAGADRITAGDGNDAIFAGEGDNTVFAGGGNNAVYAGAGNDLVTAGDGDDTIILGDGDNTVLAGGGRNTVYTGAGADSITAGSGDDTIGAGEGDNTVDAGAGNNTVIGGAGADGITTGGGDDTVYAGEGVNTIRTGGGNDTIVSGESGDLIEAGGGNNTVYAGGGSDRITAGDGDDVVVAGEGDNTVLVGGGRNTVYAGAGADVITAGEGDDVVVAGEGDNVVSLGGGANTLYAGGGNDRVTTGDGDDTVFLGEGDNAATLGEGNNTVYAGSGADTVLTGGGNDIVAVGDGANVIDAGDGANLVFAGAGDDRITTGAGNDTIVGGEGSNVILAGAGDDTVYTGAGNDTIDLGGGANLADAGAGDDLVTVTLAAAGSQVFGGAGTDTLRLAMTGAEWLSAANQAELARLDAALASPEARGGQSVISALWGLTVQGFEALSVSVDGRVVPAGGWPVEIAPVVAVEDAATLAEDEDAEGSFVLNDTVPDGPASVTLLSAPARGALEATAEGGWRYAPGGDYDFLRAGETATETVAYRVTNAGGAHGDAVLTLTILGRNDEATIAGDATGRVTEDGADLTAAGTLLVTDADAGEAAFQAVAPAALAGRYGNFTFDEATGAWSYAVDNRLAATQALREGQSVTETLTVASLDGAASKGIVVTVNGANDAPALTGVTAAAAAMAEGTSRVTFLIEGKDADSALVSASVDWGDGSPAQTWLLAGDGAGGFARSVTHDFAAGGATVSVVLSDGTLTSAASGLSVLVGQPQPAFATPVLASGAAGAAGDGPSVAPSLSGDGTKVAFESAASNLVAGDANGVSDIFVKDLSTGAVTLVSGVEANGASHGPVLSADGTKVVFQSAASNLVAGDTNGTSDLFIKDLATGTLTLVSGAGGVVGNGSSDAPVLSADGTKVAFQSYASNLAAGDDNGTADLFVKDLATGVVTLVSGAGGVVGDGYSYGAVLSADGTKVAFQSYASNLVAGDDNGTVDVFMKDLATGAITLVSGVGGAVAEGYSHSAAISADGTTVAFQSSAGNLVAGDTNGAVDVFVKDLATGAITLVSDAGGVLGNDYSQFPLLSADGTKVVFQSYASNLAAGDTNGTDDIFVKDLLTGTLTLVSGADGVVGNSYSFGAVLSANGTKVAFESYASNLVAGDDNGTVDVFVKDLATGAITLVSGAGGAAGNGTSAGPALSADGTRVAFHSDATNLVAADGNGAADVFVRGLGVGGVSLAGTGGADVLVGTAGADVLSGGAGADALRGGAGADAFVFAPGHGADRVEDFRHAEGDVLRLVGFGTGLDSLAEVLAAAVQSGADTVIATGAGGAITLAGVEKAGLVASDFLFA
ncbi:hypothetical protein EAH89_20285 [Roseomonas nepalensis]|uniref:RapA2 cadherin-like domain-containing protein n=1 Tax=Muricoccus nepalensis TaxID=1854500 RepID=A0A502FL28_9PROT|nr:VCBS domain-containing protein [Roseomonas nepalensis]TPG49876.1 hypothetical protein EAH89_20285 [Roseomonas nepalensis]